jgi:hypothetical protein
MGLHISQFETNYKQEKEKRKKRESISVTEYFPGSNIPKYDLEQIACRKGLMKEVAMLIGTRQRAKLRQLEEMECKKFSYLELWRQQWNREGGIKMTGFELRSRLAELEKRPRVSARLKRCLVKKVTTLEEIENQKSKTINEEELTTNISDRPSVFVNMDPNIIDIAVKPMSCFESKVLHFDQTIGGPLGLPIVSYIPPIKDIRRIRFHKSLGKGSSKLKQRIGEAEDRESFKCSADGCQLAFHNYNNYDIHQVMHRQEEISKKSVNDDKYLKSDNLTTNPEIETINSAIIDWSDKQNISDLYTTQTNIECCKMCSMERKT